MGSGTSGDGQATGVTVRGEQRGGRTNGGGKPSLKRAAGVRLPECSCVSPDVGAKLAIFLW